jgi:DNA-3-methyladenine glycosylase
MRVISREELPLDAAEMARFLLGKIVVRDFEIGRVSGRIVETEAYLPHDRASHSFRGLTSRNRCMFLAHGHAYIYVAYGTSQMLNVSAGEEGVGAGVLIRALEPLEGIAIMERHRGVSALRNLARGPGRLAQALAIDRTLDGIDLCRKGPLWLAADHAPERPIATSVRIGITKDAHLPLRFFVKDNPFVSGPKSLNK